MSSETLISRVSPKDIQTSQRSEIQNTSSMWIKGAESELMLVNHFGQVYLALLEPR
jgi:hypothetical protein